MNKNLVDSNRNSSVELFRIIATLLVIIVHCNGWFVGGLPDRFSFSEISTFRIGQMVIQSLSACCVNCFLIISGWYGIKLKLKTVWNINWLLIGVYVPFYIVRCIFLKEFSVYSFATRFLGILCESYFVQCYLMLMFLSPILNAFIEKQGRRMLPYVLCFWGIEFVAELIGNKSIGVEAGYSLIHFVLMYMLARSAYYYKEELMRVKRYKWVIGYIICALIICAFYLLGIKWTWHYSNPLVIMSAFCLFMPFLYKEYRNRTINWLASSTLAVYIMHTCTPLINFLRKTDIDLLENKPYPTYLCMMGGGIILVFFACIVYDKIRIWATGRLSEKLFARVETWMNKYKLLNE